MSCSSQALQIRAESAESAFEILPQPVKCPVDGGLAANQHIVVLPDGRYGQNLLGCSTQPAPHPVSLDCITDPAAHGQAITRETVPGVVVRRLRGHLQDDTGHRAFSAVRRDPPELTTGLQALEHSSGAVRRTGACGPWRAVGRESGGLQRSACAHGTRAGACARERWVEMCVSR